MTPPKDPIPTEALARAAQLVGGQQRLAQRLGVAPDDLARWMRGEATPPASVVFAALNLIEQASR